MSNNFWRSLENLSLGVAKTRRRRFLQWGSWGGIGMAIAIFNPNLSWGKETFPSDRESRDNQEFPPVADNLSTFTFEIVTVDAAGQIQSRRPGQAEYFTENLPGNVTLTLVKIPGGTFLMGSSPGELVQGDGEKPQHSVSISAFSMGKYEVTQEQYQAVMGDNPSYFKGKNNPVENVSWYEAVEFCQRLTQISQRNGKGRIYRLPSEAEWEYACRAGTTTPFYFGETIAPNLGSYNQNFLNLSYLYGSNSNQGLIPTAEVGIFPPNAFGLYDMHGNVWEWCSDRWHNNYQGAPTNGSSWDTDTGDDLRPLRGGSWDNDSWNCRSAQRYSLNPRNVAYNQGFRVCISGSA